MGPIRAYRHPEADVDDAHFFFLLPSPMGILEEERRMRVSLHAGARGFDLKLRAAFTPPLGWLSGVGSRFSAVLRLRGFIIEVRSEAPGLLRRFSFGSRLRRLFGGVLRRRTWSRHSGTDAVPAETPRRCRRSVFDRLRGIRLRPSDKKRVSCLSRETLAGLIGCLAFLSRAPSREVRGGIGINGIVLFLHLLALTAHFPVSRAPWIAPIVIFSLKYLHLMEPFPEAAWRVCALTLSLASFFLLSQSRAVLSKARVYTERNHRFRWIFIFGSLLIFYELGQRRLYEAIKAIFLGFTAWIPHLLLIWQTLSNALEEKHWDLRKWAILLLPLYFLVTKIIDILYPLGCYLHNIAIPHADGNTINDFWSLFIRS